jgi:hypothetical protein
LTVYSSWQPTGKAGYVFNNTTDYYLQHNPFTQLIPETFAVFFFSGLFTRLSGHRPSRAQPSLETTARKWHDQVSGNEIRWGPARMHSLYGIKYSHLIFLEYIHTIMLEFPS